MDSDQVTPPPPAARPNRYASASMDHEIENTRACYWAGRQVVPEWGASPVSVRKVNILPCVDLI
jgi:hypothetical protein